MNKTFAVVILASASLCALFCVSWWGDVFSEGNASPMGFPTTGISSAEPSASESSTAISSVAESPATGISANDNIQRHQYAASSSSEKLAATSTGTNLHR